MAVTATPVFPQGPKVASAKIGATALAKSDGTGTVATDMMACGQVGANGGRIKSIKFQPVATSAPTVMTSTTLRAYYSTVASGGTTGGSDTWSLGEVAGGTPSADNSTAAAAPVYIPAAVGQYVPANAYLYGSAHVVNAANSHWQMTIEWEDY